MPFKIGVARDCPNAKVVEACFNTPREVIDNGATREPLLLKSVHFPGMREFRHLRFPCLCEPMWTAGCRATENFRDRDL